MQDQSQVNEANNSAKTVNILSIDAWCDGISHCDVECADTEDCECHRCDKDHECDQCVRMWSWNNWHSVGDCDLADLPSDNDAILRYMYDNGFISAAGLAGCEIDDDQYNYVVTDKSDGRPLYAIAYGEAQ